MSLFQDQQKTGTGEPASFRCQFCGLEKPASPYGAFRHTKEDCLRQRLTMVTRSLYAERATVAKLGNKIHGQRQRLGKLEREAGKWRPTEKELKELRERTEKAVAEAQAATEMLKTVAEHERAAVREEFRTELAQLENLRARIETCEAEQHKTFNKRKR